MRFTVTSWNINSVRLRIDLVRRFVEAQRPDVLCLQETKCPDDRFPLKDIRAMGLPHVAFVGQKGYHGVAIASRHPFTTSDALRLGGKEDARHVSVTLAPEAGPAAGITVHNFYVPAGGDIPDPELNEKFAHKLAYLSDLRAWGRDARPAAARAILVGDLNVAPLETDVWSHKQLLDVVSHTPVETEALETLRTEAGWVDAMRRLRPEPERIYTWWSYRSPDWAAADKGRRLDHVWISGDLDPALRFVEVMKEARGWERPSDHAPVTAAFEL